MKQWEDEYQRELDALLGKKPKRFAKYRGYDLYIGINGQFYALDAGRHLIGPEMGVIGLRLAVDQHLDGYTPMR